MALKISYNNLPYAFSHLMELSQLPTENTYDVLFNNKTIEQAIDTTASQYAPGDEDEWGWEPDILDDPDALDKAKYQAENPNAVLTPWGPALDPEVVDAIIYDSPGVQELLDLNDEQIAEVTESADAIIDAGGDNLDEIVKQAELTAMAENLNPNEVGTGILDEMASQPPPGHEDEWGEPFFDDSSMGLTPEEIMYQYAPGDEEASLGKPFLDDSSMVQLLLEVTDEQIAEVTESEEPWWNQFLPWNWGLDTVEASGDPGDPLTQGDLTSVTETPVSDPLPVTKTGGDYGKKLKEAELSKQQAIVAQADTEFLESLLGLSSDDIMDKIREELEAGGLFPESVISWVQSHKDWTYGSPMYDFGQDALSLVAIYQEDPFGVADKPPVTITPGDTKTGGYWGQKPKDAGDIAWLDEQNLENLIEAGYHTNAAGFQRYYNPKATTNQWEPYADWEARTTSIFADAKKVEDGETDLGDMPDDRQDIAIGFLNDNLQKAFYQKFAGRPGAGRYQIRSQMDNIFADSLTLFHLYGGETNFKDSWSLNWQDYQKAVKPKVGEVADTGPLEGAYNKFLNRYMADPYGTRSGSQFDAAVSEVGRLLNLYENQILPEGHDMATFIRKGGLPGISNEDVQRLPWVIGMFGEGKGDAARRNLAHLYRTGGSKSYYAQQIHSVMDEMWDYWSAIGMSEADIFQRMTAPGEKMDADMVDSKISTTPTLDEGDLFFS